MTPTNPTPAKSRATNHLGNHLFSVCLCVEDQETLGLQGGGTPQRPPPRAKSKPKSDQSPTTKMLISVLEKVAGNQGTSKGTASPKQALDVPNWLQSALQRQPPDEVRALVGFFNKQHINTHLAVLGIPRRGFASFWDKVASTTGTTFSMGTELALETAIQELAGGKGWVPVPHPRSPSPPSSPSPPGSPRPLVSFHREPSPPTSPPTPSTEDFRSPLRKDQSDDLHSSDDNSTPARRYRGCTDEYEPASNNRSPAEAQLSSEDERDESSEDELGGSDVF